MNKPKLKISITNKTYWFSIPKDKITFEKSKTGKEFALLTLEKTQKVILGNTKMIIEKDNTFSVGIITSFNYPIYKTDFKVDGTDLKSYLMDIAKYKKETESKEQKTNDTMLEKEDIAELHKERKYAKKK